jgi:hypothetical protein
MDIKEIFIRDFGAFYFLKVIEIDEEDREHIYTEWIQKKL